ncbi:MAG TPA: SRPBCC domain-containing protein [Flavisolibacter sp.]|nr:SRPBCC domain-containing protein [Flavisolibacter sp.]
MEQKTKVVAEEGRQDIIITRDFDLPLEWLFKAYVEPEIVEQWMGTKVVKLECKKHGSYQFETTDPKGNIHRFSGTIHAFVPLQKITRTFEMEGTPFAVQLEFLEFESTSTETSKLTMHIVHKSVDDRDRMLKLPFAQGINLAHNRLQEIARKMK